MPFPLPLAPPPQEDFQIAAVHPRMGSAELPWPCQKSELAAGYDCHAAIDAPLMLWPGRLVKVPLGFALGLPPGWEAQIRPRSGLACRGLIMPNGPGTIDADYRGEVHAILHLLMHQRVDPSHLTTDWYEDKANWLTISPGDRVAQMVIAPVASVRWVQVARADLSQTARGERGFGSTGR